MFGKIWNFLSGKKTAIGMVLVIVSHVGQTVIPTGLPVWKLLDTAGLALGAGGVAHKVVKAGEEPKNE